ncbi:hypothetical protein HK101_006604, partial [Irineochytrium annulatum]
MSQSQPYLQWHQQQSSGHHPSHVPTTTSRRLTLEFILTRRSVDLPPLEHLATVSSNGLDTNPAFRDDEMVVLARRRTVEGVVRVLVEGVPLRAEKLILRFRGGRAGAHETLLKLLLWQPGSREEFEGGLQVGR